VANNPPIIPPPVERRGYRVAEFCQAFCCSRDTAYQMMKSGKLRWVDLGGRRFIPTEAAEALLKPTET
jgi:excisionase family DNA binding protein